MIQLEDTSLYIQRSRAYLAYAYILAGSVTLPEHDRFHPALSISTLSRRVTQPQIQQGHTTTIPTT